MIPFIHLSDGGADQVRTTLRSPTGRALLIRTSLFVSSPLAGIVRASGYGVTECDSERMPPERRLGEYDIIIMSSAPRPLERTFRTVRHVNGYRFSPANASFAPDIIVIVAARLAAGTVADLREQGCRVLPDMPAAIAEELAILRVERQRALQRGVVLIWVPVPSCLPRVFLVGPSWRQEEMDLNARENRLLRKLASERRAFVSVDLASEAGCKHDQVKVYVERLRAEYERCRQEVGVLLSKTEFIKSLGRELGYRLHARVKSV